VYTRPGAFFDDVLARFEAATESCAAIVRDIELAGRHIRFIFAGPALESRLIPAIAHLCADRSVEPDLVVHVWDSKSSGVTMAPAPVARGSFCERGDIAGFDENGLRIAFQPSDYSLSMFDAESGVGIFWVEDADTLPYWTQAAPFRTLFHWWVEQTGGVLVHGAVVGNGDGGVLITGKGGIGKSTTALTCLAAGFDYVGDDYVALYFDGVVTAHSLYCTAKVNPDNAARFAQFAPSLLGAAGTRGEGKMVAFLPRAPRLGVTPSIALRAILIPGFAVGAESSISEARPTALLLSAAATSLAQLPGAGRTTLDRIARAAERLPGYAIALGTAIEEIPGLIAELLRDPGQPVPGAANLRGLPFLSVVVHVRKDAAPLIVTFADLVAQHCPRLEAIIVDHGAPALEAVVEHLPFQPRIIRAQDGDPGGAACASGEVVTVLEAGDRLPAGRLGHVLEMFRDDPVLDLVVGAMFRRIPTGGRAVTLAEPMVGKADRAGTSSDAGELALGLARQSLQRKRAIAS
jgi:hypothetical protein